jgi:hypothetical protein
MNGVLRRAAACSGGRPDVLEVALQLQLAGDLAEPDRLACLTLPELERVLALAIDG